MSNCYIIQTGLVEVILNPESSSSNCCIHWEIECKKLEFGTIVNWDRKMLIKEAGLSCGIGVLLFGSWKKLEVVIAGPLFVECIYLLCVFGLLREACTPKTNAL
jgi:hypothetical protein